MLWESSSRTPITRLLDRLEFKDEGVLCDDFEGGVDKATSWEVG